ncbi:Isonitrile+hydratase [Methylocapsa aurea]|jgi:cyclohexyl-isocyanide hydratase|uniref:DJ-1/PfpI family protein n=1 Tax=Methylocapsa aurea TaxID=663610 RepID=UPI003D18D324
MKNTIDRRALMGLAALAAAAPAFAQDASDAHRRVMTSSDPTLPDPNAPKVAMLIYPKMVAIDLIGPLSVFTVARWNIQLIWKDKAPLATDVCVSIAANTTFAESYADPDILFVPGGLMGTIACMQDPAVIDFVANRGARAKWVASDCTGSLILGAAGLLEGYDATSHWAVADLLPLLGARHVDKRVVRDRNRFTAGGATAGIDLGLVLVAALDGEETSRRDQLILEYAPEPPFHNGTPAEAGPERVAAMRKRRVWMDQQARLATEAARRKLNPG